MEVRLIWEFVVVKTHNHATLFKETYLWENLMQRMKVAAIHDLSCFGKASLTIVIPTLSAMGIEVCPLPTAILSAHTGFENFTFLDLTDEMCKIIANWKSLKIHFDAIYTGFLGSPQQIDIVKEFVHSFKQPNQLVVIDPVMGDDGKLYPTMDVTMVSKMRDLIRTADIITPNTTEIALLLEEKHQQHITKYKIKKWLKILGRMGPKFVVATSVHLKGTRSGAVVGYDRESDRFWHVNHSHINAHFSGTGDTFTSVLLGSLMQGENFPVSIDRAVQFVHLAIQSTFGYNKDKAKDIALEKVLYTLRNVAPSYSYESI
jgi:pyridoxine kinase